MGVTIPSWLMWTFGIPAGVVFFWFVVLCLCLLWAHMRGSK